MVVAGCLLIHVLLPASSSLGFGEEERTKQSRSGPGRQDGLALAEMDEKLLGAFLPNAVCICRSTNSATLGNKVAHCLLYQLSQHQDICHRIWSPAVLCYWKHSTNMIQQTTT